MPADARRAHWDHVYTTRNPDEVAWHQARPALSLEFIQRAGMGCEARIIDVGGGHRGSSMPWSTMGSSE
jgi:hypothetical protein